MANIEQLIAQNQAFLYGAVVLILILVFVYKKSDKRAFKEYESQTLEERLLPDVKFMVRKLGKSTDKPLYHGDHNYLGDVKNIWFTSVDKSDLNRVGFNAGDSEEDEDKIDVCVAMIHPSKGGFLSLDYYTWLVSDIFFGNNNKTDIFIFRDESLQENSLDRMKVSSEVDFCSYAGILVEEDQRTVSKIKSIAWMKNNEQLQEKFPEFAEKVAEANPNHAESISEIKEINDQNKKRDLKRMADK